MSRKTLLFHIISVIILSIMVIYVISQDVCPGYGDYISGVGSVASLYGVILTLWQVSKVKRVAIAASNAVDKKLEDIDSFMEFADIKRHIEICKSIIVYLTNKEYEAATIRMDQLREVLVNLRQSKDLQGNDLDLSSSLILNLATDSQSIRKQIVGIAQLDVELVFSHISDVCNYLEELSSKLKRINYDKRQV